MIQEECRNYVRQNETRIYSLTQDQMDLVEMHLESLVGEKMAHHLMEGESENDTLYLIHGCVYGDNIHVELDYEKGRLEMEGDSSSLGKMVSYIISSRLGPLRLESVFKREEVESP